MMYHIWWSRNTFFIIFKKITVIWADLQGSGLNKWCEKKLLSISNEQQNLKKQSSENVKCERCAATENMRQTRVNSPDWCLPGAQSLLFFWLVMRHSCLIVGPAGRALIAATYLSRQNVAKTTRLRCKSKNGGLLVMKRSQSWLLWFRTVFSAPLNMVHK